MTYPQHIDPRYAQQYQPGAYAGQQYAPAPQQTAPAPAGASLPVPTPQLGQAASATGGGAWPKMRHLVGCTVIFIPKRVDETARDDKGQPRPEAYYDLVVVDSPTGVIRYGDSLDNDVSKRRPLAFEIAVPCVFRNVNDYGFGPVNEVRSALARGDVATVAVVEQGNKGNRPYLLTKCENLLDRELDLGLGKGVRPDGKMRYERASQVWAEVFGGTFTNPPVTSLLAAPAQPVPQVQYAAPAQAQPSAFVAAVQHEMPQPPTVQVNANPAFEAWLASLSPEQRAQFAPQAAPAVPAQQYAPPQPGAGPGI